MTTYVRQVWHLVTTGHRVTRPSRLFRRCRGPVFSPFFLIILRFILLLNKFVIIVSHKFQFDRLNTSLSRGFLLLYCFFLLKDQKGETTLQLRSSGLRTRLLYSSSSRMSVKFRLRRPSLFTFNVLL